MYISNNKYKLSAVTKDNLPVVAKILAEQFVQANEAWSSVNPSMEEA